MQPDELYSCPLVAYNAVGIFTVPPLGVPSTIRMIVMLIPLMETINILIDY
jgi:hypothetical protein